MKTVFNIGDRVVVTTHRHDSRYGQQSGGVGTIVSTDAGWGGGLMNLRVQFDAGWWQNHNVYSASDLDFLIDPSIELLGDNDEDCV